MSSQLSVPVPAWQALLAQTSPVLQALPSSQTAVLGACKQPDAGSQLSLVHTFPSLQLGAAPPVHLLLPQVSPVVQALPSSQAALLAVYVQPLPATQASSVHRLPSLHTVVMPTQLPPLHVSPVVHALPSLQASVLKLFTHPLVLSQLSSVHALLSLQFLIDAPRQSPDWHVSPVVHGLPSSQTAVLLACRQPWTALQLSVVQGVLSSQGTGVGALEHTPAEHVALPIHALLLQLAGTQTAPSLTGVWMHPPLISQESVVHALLSSHELPVPVHLPFAHTSPVVQALPSLHEPLLLVFTHPLAGLQVSSVHTLLSVQLAGLPAWQVPPEQLSPLVHALPSLQLATLLVVVQPSTESHKSFVQGFKSLHTCVAPPTQVPPWHESAVVQALLSSQPALLAACVQPVAVLQPSSVHGLLSLQPTALPPTHVPPEQTSPVVHALLSLHSALLFVCAHPPIASQLSVVHGFWSSQLTAVLPAHVPPAHTSPLVHALLSLQPSALLLWVQPPNGSQASVVHTFLSSQSVLAAPEQLPPLQTSPWVQALLSLQTAELGVCAQPVPGAQLSFVHGLLSSQFAPLPVQTPSAQLSPFVHALPSSQALVLAECRQPWIALHKSVVQVWLSSQETTAGAGWQTPIWHLAWPIKPSAVQLPSTQVTPSARLTWVQPPLVSQLSVVQGLPSLQSLPCNVPMQLPLPLHVSLTVHAFKSSQPPVLNVTMQPLTASHTSSVHTLLSSQGTGMPAWQVLSAQMSPKVQTLLSSHDAVLAV